MPIYKTLHPRDDIDGLYVSRKKEGRGLTILKNSVDASIHRLQNYMKKPGGRLITATKNNIVNTRINRTTMTRKQKWEEKQLYGRFKRLLSNISLEKNINVTKKGKH